MTRNRIKTGIILFLLCLLIPTGAMAKKKKQAVKSDREVWCEILYRMSEPVLKNMSEGKLQQNMQLELSPTWDGRDKKSFLYGSVRPVDVGNRSLALPSRR